MSDGWRNWHRCPFFQLKSQECSLKISTQPLFIHNYKTKSRTTTQVFNHQLAIQLLSKNGWPYGIQSILKRSISLRCQDRQLDDVWRWTRIAHNATKVARRITQRRRIWIFCEWLHSPYNSGVCTPRQDSCPKHIRWTLIQNILPHATTVNQ